MGQEERRDGRPISMSGLQCRTLYFVVFFLWGCAELPGEPPRLGRHGYSTALSAEPCPLGERSGPGGMSNDEQTEYGTKYAVRTPANYDARILHPLLMVYAPAGASRFRSERLTNLTFEATTAGFVVAYVDARRLSLEVIPELGTIPRRIAQRWCVDERRVYLTGHSDGGTVALALALLDQTRHIPAAVAPSAAGFRRADLETFPCPEPLSALILHSATDHLFPGYGAETAAWLASCNACQSDLGDRDENGCRTYSGCRANSRIIYCEGGGAHGQWPALNTALLSFFVDIDRSLRSVGLPCSAVVSPSPACYLSMVGNRPKCCTN